MQFVQMNPEGAHVAGQCERWKPFSLRDRDAIVRRLALTVEKLQVRIILRHQDRSPRGVAVERKNLDLPVGGTAKEVREQPFRFLYSLYGAVGRYHRIVQIDLGF